MFLFVSPGNVAKTESVEFLSPEGILNSCRACTIVLGVYRFYFSSVGGGTRIILSSDPVYLVTLLVLLVLLVITMHDQFSYDNSFCSP